MTKQAKILGIFSLISGCAMFLIWGLFWMTGFLAEEARATPISFSILLLAEFLTATLLIAGGIGIMRKQAWGTRLSLVSMGMMQYAVIFAAGQFAQKHHLFLTVFFSIIGIITAVILIVTILTSDYT
jgi:hypothetical protein